MWINNIKSISYKWGKYITTVAIVKHVTPKQTQNIIHIQSMCVNCTIIPRKKLRKRRGGNHNQKKVNSKDQD